MSNKKTMVGVGIAVLVFSAVVIGGFAFVSRGISTGACTFTVTASAPSPDGKLKAQLGYTNCGGTSDFEGGVHVENTQDGKTYSGILGFRGKSDGASLAWTNANTLVVGGLQIENLLWFRQDSFSGMRVILKSGTVKQPVYVNPQQ